MQKRVVFFREGPCAGPPAPGVCFGPGVGRKAGVALRFYAAGAPLADNRNAAGKAPAAEKRICLPEGEIRPAFSVFRSAEAGRRQE